MTHKFYHIHIDRSVKQYTSFYKQFVQITYSYYDQSVEHALPDWKLNQKSIDLIQIMFLKQKAPKR